MCFLVAGIRVVQEIGFLAPPEWITSRVNKRFGHEVSDTPLTQLVRRRAKKVKKYALLQRDKR